MLKTIGKWFGFGRISDPHGHGSHGHSHGGTGGHGHTHGLIDASISSSERGIWAIKWSFVILAVTAVFQLVVVFYSGSVALLADTIHNVGDAATAVPLWIAFTLVRRPATKVFNYGLGRVEDFAGMLIVLIILFSAIVAGYEAINRLFHPQEITRLVGVAVAGVVGFVGNEVVALLRIKVGREMNSAALIADGYHARTDGLTSLAVVLGAVGVWLGLPLADPIIGLLITVAIFGIVWQSAKAVVTRSLDGIEPNVTDEIRHAAEHVPGIRKITDVKARWIGHRLHADVTILVDADQPVAKANGIAIALRQELKSHLPQLETATIQFDPEGGVTQASHQAGAHHHAPDPFTVNSSLATGRLEIIDTPDGERMCLTLHTHVDDLEAIVEIDRGADGLERLPLVASKNDRRAMISAVAPAEPHQFDAVLLLTVGARVDELSFSMVEPEGHKH